MVTSRLATKYKINLKVGYCRRSRQYCPKNHKKNLLFYVGRNDCDPHKA